MPLATDIVYVMPTHVVTSTAAVTVTSMTVSGSGTLSLDGTSQAVPMTVKGGGKLSNNGTVSIANSANAVTLQGDAAGAMTFAGTDVSWNAKKVYLSSVTYTAAMNLTAGATVQMAGPVTFSQITTNAGSIFNQGTSNNVIVTSTTTFAAGTFVKDAGTGTITFQGTFTLNANNQNLGKIKF